MDQQTARQGLFPPHDVVDCMGKEREELEGFYDLWRDEARGTGAMT